MINFYDFLLILYDFVLICKAMLLFSNRQDKFVFKAQLTMF